MNVIRPVLERLRRAFGGGGAAADPALSAPLKPLPLLGPVPQTAKAAEAPPDTTTAILDLPKAATSADASGALRAGSLLRQALADAETPQPQTASGGPAATAPIFRSTVAKQDPSDIKPLT